MYALVITVLVLALLSQSAAASSPVMDPTLSMDAMGYYYPDPDNVLDAFCDVCGMMNVCVCVMAHPPPYPRAITAETFYSHPEWPREHPTLLDGFGSEPEPYVPHVPRDARQPLHDEVIRLLDANATTVQPATVQRHVEDTYTPGDRAIRKAGQRQHSYRRQASRPDGYPCDFAGCLKTFSRSCDLKRHSKTHLERSERPYKCSICSEGFLYPKDLKRHTRTHDQQLASPATLYHCQVPGCGNADGFSRHDNLRRHQRNKHPGFVATV